MTCMHAPVPSHLVSETGHRGHVEQIWWRRSHDTWCGWIRAIDDSRWARGEVVPPKSCEEACAEWVARMGESGAGLDLLLAVS
jgi:hypothetical protein